MSCKFIFKRFVADNNISPIYVPQFGHIVDEYSGNLIYRLPEKELKPFFYFKIQFDGYNYSSYYQPKTGGFKKKISCKIDHFILYLNIDNIVRDNNTNTILRQKLLTYFTQIQIIEILKKDSYIKNQNNISEFINYRNNDPMYFIPWYYYRINEKYIFDLQEARVLLASQARKIKFSRKGGIIESNNIKKIVMDYFIKKNNDKTLVILPSKLSNLWPKVNKITFEEIEHFNQNIKIENFDKYTKIIIHECSENILSSIKAIINRIDPHTVWLINSLPLRYYFDKPCSEKTKHVNPPHCGQDKYKNTIKINQIHTISNLWANFNLEKKKLYKRELVRLYLTKFNQYYAQINYENSEQITIIKLDLEPLEKNIYEIFDKYFSNWKNKLTNEQNNIYSVAGKNKIDRIEKQIFDSMVSLSLSVVEYKSVPVFFKDKIKYYLKTAITANKQFDAIIKSYTNNPMTYETQSEFDSIISTLLDKQIDIQKIIANCKRYLAAGNTDNDDICPICYGDGGTKTKLICGHEVCLECILHSLSKSDKCPICKEHVDIRSIAIIKETVGDYKSSVIKYLEKLPTDSLVLTDLDCFAKDKIHGINILNTKNTKLIGDLNEIDFVPKKVVIVASKNFHNNNRNIIGYFGSINKNINFEILEFILPTKK